jgi:hypothetical protein
VDSRPAAAYDAFLPVASAASAAQRVWTPDDGPLPGCASSGPRAYS